MAHRSRAGFVCDLLKKLDAPAGVVFDEHENEWDTGRRAWLAHDPEADWHCVLQDDAVVCRDLVAGLNNALRYVTEGSPVSLYAGRKRPHEHRMQALTKRADEQSASWLVMRDIDWGVGLVFPTTRILEIVETADRSHVEQYDARLSAYFARRKIPVYYTWPSLVDHRDGDSLLAGKPAEGRVAYRFASSALDIDWSGPTVGHP